MKMELTWPIFKDFIDDRELSVQWLDLGDTYFLAGMDGRFEVACKLYKLSDNADELLYIEDFEDNYKALGNISPRSSVDVVMIAPFANKIIDGKTLYKRIMGFKQTLVQGANTFEYVIPYNWAKMTGIEVVGAEIGDTSDFTVLDTAQGTYSGVPNYRFNQYAFSVNLAEKFYKHKSEFDSDVYIGLRIELVYTSISAKTIGINIILNEVK